MGSDWVGLRGGLLIQSSPEPPTPPPPRLALARAANQSSSASGFTQQRRQAYRRASSSGYSRQQAVSLFPLLPSQVSCVAPQEDRQLVLAVLQRVRRAAVLLYRDSRRRGRQRVGRGRIAAAEARHGTAQLAMGWLRGAPAQALPHPAVATASPDSFYSALTLRSKKLLASS